MKQEHFFFGAASSSHQVEGGQTNDWTEWEKENASRLAAHARKKDWPAFIREKYPAPTDEENYVSGRAADHWNRYEEDFDIAKELGHNAHRFSIEWSRVEPEEGKFDEAALAHYRNVVRALRARGLEPFVTLWHFTLPVWVTRQGGWESERTVAHFARYVGRVAAALQGEVKFWIPLNEPEIYAHMAYLTGEWPPERKNPFRTFSVMMRLARAHRAAYAVLRGLAPDAQVGIAKNHVYFEAAGLNQWNELLKAVAEWWWNFFFLDRVKDSLDFIGVNFYFYNRIEGWFAANGHEVTNDMGWKMAPEALAHALRDLMRYGLPLYVTENGLADARDIHRGGFLLEALGALARAKKEGVDVRGYFHWALTDNFEWADGFWPRFGLVEVDYRTEERRIRASALVYRDLIKKWPDL